MRFFLAVLVALAGFVAPVQAQKFPSKPIRLIVPVPPGSGTDLIARTLGTKMSQNMGVPAYLVDNAADLRPEWIAGKRRVGITAGASAPEVLVEQLIARLKSLGAKSVRPLEGISENVVFTLPRGLART